MLGVGNRFIFKIFILFIIIVLFVFIFIKHIGYLNSFNYTNLSSSALIQETGHVIRKPFSNEANMSQAANLRNERFVVTISSSVLAMITGLDYFLLADLPFNALIIALCIFAFGSKFLKSKKLGIICGLIYLLDPNLIGLTFNTNIQAYGYILFFCALLVFVRKSGGIKYNFTPIDKILLICFFAGLVFSYYSLEMYFFVFCCLLFLSIFLNRNVNGINISVYFLFIFIVIMHLCEPLMYNTIVATILDPNYSIVDTLSTYLTNIFSIFAGNDSGSNVPTMVDAPYLVMIFNYFLYLLIGIPVIVGVILIMRKLIRGLLVFDDVVYLCLFGMVVVAALSYIPYGNYVNQALILFFFPTLSIWVVKNYNSKHIMKYVSLLIVVCMLRFSLHSTMIWNYENSFCENFEIKTVSCLMDYDNDISFVSDVSTSAKFLLASSYLCPDIVDNVNSFSFRDKKDVEPFFLGEGIKEAYADLPGKEVYFGLNTRMLKSGFIGDKWYHYKPLNIDILNNIIVNKVYDGKSFKLLYKKIDKSN